MIQDINSLSGKNSTTWSHEALYRWFHNLYKSKLSWEKYDEIKSHINDQVLKTHLAYRLVKTWFDKKHWKQYNANKFNQFVEKQLDHLRLSFNPNISVWDTVKDFVYLFLLESNLSFENQEIYDFYGIEMADALEKKNPQLLEKNWVNPRWTVESIEKTELRFKNLIQTVIDYSNNIGEKTLLINENESYQDKLLGQLKLAFAISELKHHGTWRTNKIDEYIEHPIAVSKINMQNLWSEYTIKQTIVDILHDVYEDSNVTFETLYKNFWAEIALAVITVSKRSPLTFIRDCTKGENDDIKFLRNQWIINSKMYLTDYFKSVLRNIEDKRNIKTSDDVEEYHERLIHLWLSEEDINGLKLYFDLYKDNKQKRDNEYFWVRFEDIQESIHSFAKAFGIEKTEYNVDITAKNVAVCKAWDRTHNNSDKKKLADGVTIDEAHWEKNIKTTRKIFPWIIKELWIEHKSCIALAESASIQISDILENNVSENSDETLLIA